MARGRPARPGRRGGGARARARAPHLLHLAWTTEHGQFWDDPANLDWARATCELVRGVRRGRWRARRDGRQLRAVRLGQRSAVRTAATRRQARGAPATLYGRAKQATAELLAAGRQRRAFVGDRAALLPVRPVDEPERLVPRARERSLAGEEATVSAGTQVRDFVHVDGLRRRARGTRSTAMSRARSTSAPAVATSVAEVAPTVARLVGREDCCGSARCPRRTSARGRRRRGAPA